MTEVLANKKAYNTRKKELLEAGYCKAGEWGNSETFRKCHDTTKLVKGWMKG